MTGENLRNVRRVVVVSAVDVEVQHGRESMRRPPALHESVPRALAELGRQQVVGVAARGCGGEGKGTETERHGQSQWVDNS